MPESADALDWLLNSREPAIRLQARRDVLGETDIDFGEVVDGQAARALFAGQDDDGGFGVHPYSKWLGAHWRLVSLTELGVPPGEPRMLAALDTVLAWLSGDGHRRGIREIEGLTRRCASQEGNALAVACRAGMAHDPRIQRLAEDLIRWQWPDGGWNCDKRPEARHSSVNESLPPMWGLHEYWLATGSDGARAAADRAAEFFLRHSIFRSHTTGEVMHRNVTLLRFPAYWHYNVLQALSVHARLGYASDPRASDALDLVESKRKPDGRWHAEGAWWNSASSRSYPEVVDWQRSGPNEWLTLAALRVLKAAGR